jgi:hypothetical protein
MMAELRLPKLPDRTPVRITISISPDLNRRLADYAALYEESYGHTEPVQELIPAMLERFIEGDRAFTQRQRDEGSTRRRA